MIRGLDHIEPLTADIPGVRRQPAEVVRVAYWYGVRLHNYGWRLRSVRYLALGRDWCSAEVALETPTHRATVYRADKTTTATDLPGCSPPRSARWGSAVVSARWIGYLRDWIRCSESILTLRCVTFGCITAQFRSCGGLPTS